MWHEPAACAGGWRRALRWTIAALGVVTIVGSGGGMPGFCDWDCGGDIVTPPLVPWASLTPARTTVQVGGTVDFVLRYGELLKTSFQWCRQPAGTDACTDIPGASAQTYTLVGANLADHGSRFRVKVTGSNGTLWADSELLVSPMPGVVLSDGDFADADWTTDAVLLPAQGGPSYRLSRSPDGGQPGAYLHWVADLPLAPASVIVYRLHTTALYDPASQGAILSLDFAEDCRAAEANYLGFTLPLIAQAGRRYTALRSWASSGCVAPSWQASDRPSLGAAEFEQVDGPPCGKGESCPDFSATGAPIRFGLALGAELSSGLPPGQIAHVDRGLDNWRVTVWRR